jgi:hypothetical protein
MTTEQAIELGNQVRRPAQRRPLDKRQGSSATAEDISAGVTALAKSYATMGGTLADMQRRIDQAAADVEFIKHFEPGQPPRRMHS